MNSSATPSLSDPGWNVAPPTSYMFGGTGSRTAYAWVADLYGNISPAASQTVVITPSFNPSNYSLQTPSTYFGNSQGALLNYPTVPFDGLRLWLQTPSVGWSFLEPARGGYNWTSLDQWLAAAQANGQAVMYTFGMVPGWATSDTSSCGAGGVSCRAPPADVTSGDAMWKEYVTALVQHSLSSPTAHIKYYELWNEPNLAAFYTGTMPQLVTMSCDAYAIIHQLDPNAVVISPPYSGDGTDAPGWLAQYFAAGGTHCQDAISYHAYVGGSDPSRLWTITNNIRAIMTAYGIGNEPLFQTEGGSGGIGGSLSSVQQAGYAGTFYTIGWAQNLAGNYWYAWDGGSGWLLWDPVTGEAPGGIAYAQIYNWLHNAYKPSSTPCYQSVDGTWHCNLTLANGNPAQIIWNETTSKTLSVSPSFTSYETLNNSTKSAIVGNSVTVGIEPTLLIDEEFSSQPTTAVQSAPTVTDFVMPTTATSATTTSATVPVITFSASDAYLPVAGYLITETPTTPSASDPNWATSTPITFTFAGIGARTAYAWVKDTAGNISAAASQVVTITQAAPTNVYYSVGQTTANLMTGTPTITVAGGAAVFSVPQTGNIGVGDVVVYGSGQVAYISGKTGGDQRHWSLITSTGGTAPNATNAPVSSITRAYTRLTDSVKAASDQAHLGTIDLRALNVVLNFPCYYDLATDTAAVWLPINDTSGNRKWLTGPYNYINIFTPYDTAAQVNRSQRHQGVWTPSAYTLSSTGQYAIQINADYLRISGLQILANYAGGYGRTIMMDGMTSLAGMIVIDDNIIRGAFSGNNPNEEAIGYTNPNASTTLAIFNNIIYNYVPGSSGSQGVYIVGGATAYVYNNTVYNVQTAYRFGAGSYGTPLVYAKNNIAQSGTAGYNASGSIIGASSANNLSDHADAIGSNPQNSKTVAFNNAAGGDFHLAYTDTVAKDMGVDLSADAYWPFNYDADMQTRPFGAQWDLGADEYLPPAPTITAFALAPTSSSLTVPVTAFTATDASSSVTGYLITGTYSIPSASDPGWSAIPPVSFTFSDFRITNGLCVGEKHRGQYFCQHEHPCRDQPPGNYRQLIWRFWRRVRWRRGWWWRWRRRHCGAVRQHQHQYKLRD